MTLAVRTGYLFPLFLLALDVCHTPSSAQDDARDKLPLYRSPQPIVLSPDGQSFYVGDVTARCVAVFDMKTGAKHREISLRGQPRGLAISSDGRRLFATERGQLESEIVTMMRFPTAAPVSLIVLLHIVYAAEQQPVVVPTGKALLVRSTPSPSGPRVQINLVDRSKISEALFVDMFGLRLWIDGGESANRIGELIATPAAALGIKQQLAAELMETGVEPEMIPVRGEAGNQIGKDGMILLEGGEFRRSGEFYDSSGGGLTILKDGTAQISRGARYRVRVSSFYIDKFKVTNAEYCKFLNDGNAGYWTPWNPRIVKAVEGKNTGKFVPADHSLARHPVVLVNWYQARGFAAWAGKRLPTEAEWEYAAGGKEGRMYPWGNEPPDETRLDFPIQHNHPVPVDWFPKGATPEGVFQMAGNSAEWCADYFDHASYAQAPTGGVAVDPTGAKQAFQPATWYKYRVMFKGWCKANRAEYFTCTKRHSRPPLADASAGVSFRCVKSAVPVGNAGEVATTSK